MAAPSPSPTVIERPSLLMILTACDVAAYFGGYCAAKLPRAIKHLTWKVPKHPLRQSTGEILIRDGHALFPIGSDATIMAELV